MRMTNPSLLRAQSSTAPRGYAAAILLVAMSTLAGLLIAPRWGSGAVDLLFLPAVLAVAILGGLGPALLAAIASALAYNYFFTAPYRTFFIHSPSDVVTVVVLFLVAAVTSQLAASIRRQARLAGVHAARNATIAGLARTLLSCTSEQEIADVAVRELGQVFASNAVMLAGPEDPRPVASAPAAVQLTPSDLAAASTVFTTGTPTGRGFSRVTTVDWQLHPVRSGGSVLRVIALARDDGLPPVGDGQFELLDSLLDQVALAIERARWESEARDFSALRERDRLRSALVASIGQDLNPSLAEIERTVAKLRREATGDRTAIAGIGRETAKIQRYLANLIELGPATDQKPVETGGVRIDIFRREVTREGEIVHLTPKEYAVLAELAKHPGRVLSHAHLLKVAWGPAQQGHTEYLRVAVRALRQKLEGDPKRPAIILNEPAIGYRLAG
jgi:two-component system sensor histidine kinase KdpD